MTTPRYRVVAIDETANWDSAITAITGRIAGVYLINFAEVTHAASLRGSYWAEFICNITEHYVREPDGYDDGVAMWDEDADPDAVARGKALEMLWDEPFYGLQYIGADESSHYRDEGFPEPQNSLITMPDEWHADTLAMSADDAEAYRKQRDEAARDAVSESMANGEDWHDIAPWKV